MPETLMLHPAYQTNRGTRDRLKYCMDKWLKRVHISVVAMRSQRAAPSVTLDRPHEPVSVPQRTQRELLSVPSSDVAPGE
jgi:hypothetical protein